MENPSMDELGVPFQEPSMFYHLWWFTYGGLHTWRLSKVSFLDIVTLQRIFVDPPDQ